MPQPRQLTKLIFRPEYGERNLGEAQERGYLSHVFVEIDAAALFPVFFYTLDRLHGDLNTMTKQGEPFIAETGMIVVSELTLEVIEATVQRLCDGGYFNHMVPVTLDQIAKADPFNWPP